MAIKVKKNTPVNEMPFLGILCGGAKVGKSHFCSDIKNALIVDLEGVGYDHLPVEHLIALEGIGELEEAIEYFFKSSHDVLVIDHLKMLTNFYCRKIAAAAGKATISQIPFGQGSDELRTEMFSFMSSIRSKIQKHKKRVLMVAHTKPSPKGGFSLDIDSKIDLLFTSMCDYIAVMYMQGPNRKIKFNSGGGSDMGCRNKFLKDFNGDASWAKLCEVARGPK